MRKCKKGLHDLDVTGEYVNGSRSRCRECHRAKRREQYKASKDYPITEQRAPQKGYIPVEGLVGILRPFMETQEATSGGMTFGAIVTLGIRAQVSPDTIHNLLWRKDKRYIDFDTADRILCAAGLNHLWWVSEEDGGLREVYYAADLSGTSRMKPWIPEFEDRVCANEECEEGGVFSVIKNSNYPHNKTKKFCSVACNLAVNGQKGIDKQRPKVSKEIRARHARSKPKAKA